MGSAMPAVNLLLSGFHVTFTVTSPMFSGFVTCSASPSSSRVNVMCPSNPDDSASRSESVWVLSAGMGDVSMSSASSMPMVMVPKSMSPFLSHRASVPLVNT